MGKKVILNFDESGNMGTRGRYFTIACVETYNTKPLENVMKKIILKTRKKFSKYEEMKEIKAKDAGIVVKDYFLRSICSKNVRIRYIVADLENVYEHLKEDKNLLYNYMLQFLIIPAIQGKNVDHLELNLDKRTIKVQSGNSFEDYINIKLKYELGFNLDIKVNYLESHNSYEIQAADFVANSIQSKYEFGHDYLYNIMVEKIVQAEEFPRKFFGQAKVVNF